MDIGKRFQLIKGIAEEIVTEEELIELLGQKSKPIAYDGFEPSGLAHLPFGVFRPLLLKDLMKAGLKFKLFLADWHAWLNNKMGGDLEKIQKVGKYFLEVWRAAGVDMDKIKVVWASDLAKQPEYWKKVILVAKNCTIARANRALTIMGRKVGELAEVSQYFYPAMQVADIFQIGIDICQLGLDQRRANVLAREIGPKLGWQKPIIVSHHMLMGLEGRKQPEGYDVNTDRDIEIASKMSKSKPQTCIFVHDSRDEIIRKIQTAYCPPRDAINNPVLDYCRHIIFRAFGRMDIFRTREYGGPLTFDNYQELEGLYVGGQLHPADLKAAVADYLDQMISPIRKHFEKNRRAKELYDFVKKHEITR